MALFIAGHAIAALAPGFGVLMLGRAVAAAAHGCFFGIAILLGASIAPPGRQGMALAIVVGGINVANIVGVPLGTAVGTAWGWRAAFVMVGLIALAAFVAIALFVPNAVAGAACRERLPCPGPGARATAASSPPTRSSCCT